MNIYICIILSLILAGLGFYKKAFTNIALLVAFLISFTMCYCGGYVAFCCLVLLFIITIVTDKIGKSKKKEIENNKHNKDNRRDVIQVLANLLIATIFIIMYKFTNTKIYLIAFFVSLAESAADTSASGIGILSKYSYNILTFKKAEKGLSGNVSFIGFGASLLAAIIIGSLYYIYSNSISEMLIIVSLGFIGAIIDSILGCIQVKYKCTKCNMITEREFHCNKKTKYYKGIKYLNNDLVNFVSNISVCLILLILNINL